ncbi:MAG: hypothetical protein RLZ14_1946 [Actinomycetota bacterium]|jgi:hypothetical protein
MSVWARLGAFVLVLLGTFGTAYSLGEKLPGHSHSHNHSHGPSSLVAPGFENNGYTLVTDGIAVDGGVRTATFHLEKSGTRVTNFPEAHGARLHTVLVRPDLSDFSHIHPTIADDGSWSVTVDQPGQWHLVFDTTPDNNPVVVSANLDDETKVEPTPLPAADDDVVVSGLHIVRTGLDFTVTAEDGTPATGLEPYLGMAAHLIAVRDGDLSYVHLHPTMEMTGMFMFGTKLPQPGTYRLFLQFGLRGDVITVPFTAVQA